MRGIYEILVIQLWTYDLAAVRSALRDAELDAQVTRVDIEPALNAALVTDDFDLAIYVPTPTLPRAIAAQRLREHGVELVDAEPLATLGERIAASFDRRRN